MLVENVVLSVVGRRMSIDKKSGIGLQHIDHHLVALSYENNISRPNLLMLELLDYPSCVWSLCALSLGGYGVVLATELAIIQCSGGATEQLVSQKLFMDDSSSSVLPR